MTQNNVMIMPFDNTCDGLTGATIHSAHREGIWLVLSFRDRNGRDRVLHFSGRTTKGHAYCGKCGEERMIETVRDKGMAPRSYCNVCGHHWELVT